MPDISLGALQGALAVSRSYPGLVDGIAGPMTRKAIRKEPDTARKIAEQVGGAAARVVEDALEAEPANADVIRIITEASQEFNVPVQTMIAKAKVESNLDPAAINQYGYAGLFQMGRSSWSDARDVVTRLGLPDIGPFDTNKLDARQNARAACAYRIALINQLARQGIVNPSEAELYLAHQQGAAGYAVLRKAANGAPIPDSDLSRVTQALRNNPPQDGKGVTYDPKSFIDRWEDVFTVRLGEGAVGGTV